MVTFFEIYLIIVYTKVDFIPYTIWDYISSIQIVTYALVSLYL